MPEIVRDRDELLLNAIATGDATDIDPRDREEKFLKAIAEKIGTAGKSIYRHRINLRCTVEGAQLVIAADILNHNSEDYADYAAIAADADHLVDYHYVSGGVSNVPGFAIQRIHATGSVLRMTYTFMQQDADTKVVSGYSSYVDLIL